ncbi:zinc dependent phospholipase C family protein [Hymenobacter persicinus]|uniref:zinc dependent phospholipase C family protein n=1 Tax=Hymenobacter persicinus TaxID=2025506 RepID=UPI001F5DD2A0|nr:zinc dependent phospholipase C family protein [Hymenobacter persicinus]
MLTHQANIDSTWKRCLLPLLQTRFPGATKEELIEAKSYAYGGAIIQDMGFYPFGSQLFTNLTHYVRSGDFVRNLIEDSQDRNEYAFALGALGHYAADINGHPEGTNKAMASVYPDLKAQFGNIITYDEAPKQHTQLEFAFDVVQVAAGRYRTEDYHSYIGFKVSKPVLERAFEKTYGLKLGQVIANVDLSISSYRFAVSQLIPTATRAAWQSQRKEIRALSPQVRRREFIYNQSARKYRKEFGTDYEQPGTGARILSLVVRILPKIGPLKPFAFKLPTPEAQAFFKSSFNMVLKNYCSLLEQVRDKPQNLRLANTDFDTGHQTKTGEYPLADKTYGEWLRKLAKEKFEGVSAPLKQNILAFYGDAPKPSKDEEEKEASTFKETQQALAELKALPVQ